MARMRRQTASVAASQDAAISAGIRLLSVLLLLIAVALALDWLLRSENFPVENVHFEGPFGHVSKEQLVKTVKDQARGNFFALDLDAIKARVEALPWIYRASVRRYWPRDLYINFSEQQLVARWGEHAWLNEAGELVRLPDTSTGNLKLPELSGPQGTHAQVLQCYHDFAQQLQSSGLHISAVNLSSRRTWSVRLSDGFTLLLAREDSQRKLARFVQVYTRKLAALERSIKQVDLRYTNGLSVEWLEAPATPLQAGLIQAH
jgi:cell division protein FtsQ